MPREAYIGPEHCDKRGAARLAEYINDYWKQRGGNANARIIEAGFTEAMRSARFDIRSDLVNGMPKS